MATKLPSVSDSKEDLHHGPSPWLMAALLAFFAALFLPKSHPFPFDFETGKRWNYADLHAPFDFEVLRSEADLKEDLAKINENQIEYWQFDPEIGRRQIRVFEAEFDAQIAKSRHDLGFADLVANQSAYKSFGTGILRTLFSDGILNMDTAQFRRRKADFVMVNRQNSTARQKVESMRPIYFAQEYLTDTLPFSGLVNPELLLPIFEKSLVANIFLNDSLTQTNRKAMLDNIARTGISVQKNALIVAKNAEITPEIAQKLHSLSNRFATPNPRFQIIGHFALAGLASIALALLVLVYFPEKWDDRRQSMLIFGSVMAIILVFSGLARLGSPRVLATPMLFLLFFLHQFFQKDLVWMAYLLAVLLTGLALDWGFGWCVIQFAGGFTLLLFPRRIVKWRGRLVVAGTAGAVMTVALFGVILAGKFTRYSSYFLSPILLWIGVFSSLAAFKLADFFRKKLASKGNLYRELPEGE